MVDVLTPKVWRAPHELVNLFQASGRIPTQAELANQLVLRSKNSVGQYLRQLERKGYVHRETYNWRGVMISVPIVGQVVCG